jgi:SAM-dependent methyltransferase
MSTFTAHNIRLDDGSYTKPGLGWEMTQHPLLLAVARLFEGIYPNGHRGKSIADLGCLEGGYAAEFARLGFEATGIEIRQSNFENCLRVKAGINLPNLRFIKDDAWNVSKYGSFDIVFCSGLLYHLNDPRRFLSVLAGVCNHLLILDTQYSTEENSDYFPLSDLAEHEGLRGRWFTEYLPGNAAEIEDANWAAWSNHRSFWPLYSDLSLAIREAGFTSVVELADSRSSELIKQRTTLVAVK